jgi:hypothetical protein
MVRVRQRALQKPCKSGLFRFFCRRNLQELQYAVDMEPFMELSDPEGGSCVPAAAVRSAPHRRFFSD